MVRYCSLTCVFCTWLSLVLGASAFGEDQVVPRGIHQDLSFYLDQNGTRRPIQTSDQWENRKLAIKKGLEQVLGEFPTPVKRVPLDVKILEVTHVGEVTCQKVSYQSDATDRVTAYLMIPDKREGKTPAVLCLHQTTKIGKGEPAGFGGDPNLHYARHLADLGFITFAPDYPSFGEHPYDFSERHHYSSGSMKAVWDNVRAVDLLQGLPEVDGERIGCIGHSLGGHNALFTAAFEPRLKVVVSSCGFTRFHRDDLPSWTGRNYMPRIASQFDNNPDKMPFDFPEIIGLLAPRPFLACAATHDDDFQVLGVRESLEYALPAYRRFNAEKNLLGYYPESGHGFPADARDVAYRFLQQHLAKSVSSK